MDRKGWVVIVMLAVSPLVGVAGSEAMEKVMYYCPICDSGFYSVEEWQHYMELNHPKVDTQGKTPIKTSIENYEAMIESKKVEILPCPVCDSGFISEAEWRHHMEVHHPAAMAEAKKPKVLSREEYLQTLKKEAATDEEIYYCPICDSGFFSEEEWRHYLEVNHPDVDVTGKSPMKVKRSELGAMKKKHHKGSEHKEEMKGSEHKEEHKGSKHKEEKKGSEHKK